MITYLLDDRVVRGCRVVLDTVRLLQGFLGFGCDTIERFIVCEQAAVRIARLDVKTRKFSRQRTYIFSGSSTSRRSLASLWNSISSSMDHCGEMTTEDSRVRVFCEINEY